MKKRMLSLVLVLALVAGLLPAALAAETPFTLSTGTVTACQEHGFSSYSGDVDFYTVTLPQGTQSLTLTFTEDRIAYAYDYAPEAQYDTYLYACAPSGEYENNGQTGETTAAVTAKASGAFPDYVVVQTPYDSSWSSATLFAVRFQVEEGGTDAPGEGDGEVDADKLLENVAKSYAAGGDFWKVIGVSAYDASLLTDGARSEYAVSAAAAITAADATPGGVATAILGLRALGYDPARIIAADGTSVSAYEKLAAFDHSQTSQYDAPYVLLALQQADQGPDAATADTLISTLMTAATDTYLFPAWGFEDAGTAGMTLAAVLPYAEDNAEAAALKSGILAAFAQKNYVFGDANSDALALLGLSAAGVDGEAIQAAAEDLLGYALTDNSGFGYSSNDEFNDYATKQAFAALVAAQNAADGPYNLFDFSGNDAAPVYGAFAGCPVIFHTVPEDAAVAVTDGDGAAVAPAFGSTYDLSAGTYSYTVSKAGYTAKTGTLTVTAGEAAARTARTVPVSLSRAVPASGETGTVQVTVRVLAHDAAACRNSLTYKHNASSYTSLLPEDGYTVTLERNVGTARDALVAALDAGNISYTEKSNGYFPAIGGYEELTHGGNSGWLYMVDGKAATKAANQTTFDANSTMVWWFTDDYSTDYGSEPWDDGGKTPVPSTPSVQPTGLSVTTAEAEDGTVQVQVRAGGKTVEHMEGGVRVSLPAGNTDAGTVLVLVDRDGNETVVKKSVVDGDEISALLDGSCTVKIVDNTKSFADAAGHWAENAIAFASSRELFQGTGGGRFSPDEPMNRAMLATVLWRLEDQAEGTEESFADVEEGAWYAEGVAWAAGKGIVTGYGGNAFGPMDNITREQLAVMLYRYANSLGMDTGADGDLSAYEDAAAVSDWAADAMAWAVDSGLLTGRSSARLDPAGDATRAEVATVLERLVRKMVQ